MMILNQTIIAVQKKAQPKRKGSGKGLVFIF